MTSCDFACLKFDNRSSHYKEVELYDLFCELHTVSWSPFMTYAHEWSVNIAYKFHCDLQEDAHDFLRQWLDKAHEVHLKLLKTQQPESKVHTASSSLCHQSVCSAPKLRLQQCSTLQQYRLWSPTTL